MWMIDPAACMCRKHLLGEHVETHMIAGAIRKKKKLNGYVKANALEIASLVARHNALADEMIRRGYKHNSPLKAQDTSYLPDFVRGSRVNREKSMTMLFNRCADCKARKETEYENY
jgi:hypothetical protein